MCRDNKQIDKSPVCTQYQSEGISICFPLSSPAGRQFRRDVAQRQVCVHCCGMANGIWVMCKALNYFTSLLLFFFFYLFCYCCLSVEGKILLVACVIDALIYLIKGNKWHWGLVLPGTVYIFDMWGQVSFNLGNDDKNKWSCCIFTADINWK